MAQNSRPLSILFADISKSSYIYESLGDHRAREVISRVLESLSGEAMKFEGRVIKTLGDAAMCTFEVADNAVAAAKSMLLTLNSPIDDLPDTPVVNIHIGIHYGMVVEENNDIFGDAVNVAARVVDYANPRQIVVTRETIVNLTESSAHSIRYVATVTVKNISGEIELFEIGFENQDLTMVLDTRKVAEEICPSLYLTRGDELIVIDISRPMISIGREEHNDIVVKYSWISRTHARIENRNGIIVLTDKSTNGIFVYPAHADSIYLNKSEQPLTGEGVIILGREKTDDNTEGFDDILQYVVK